MVMDLNTLAQLISSATGLATFLLALFIAFTANRIHLKTDELVVHTNSLTDKLMEKTDVIARAEGVREGQSMTPDPAIANALATVMADAVLAAAELAANKVMAAAQLAREVKKES
jgi:hypothetical protein